LRHVSGLEDFEKVTGLKPDLIFMVGCQACTAASPSRS